MGIQCSWREMCTSLMEDWGYHTIDDMAVWWDNPAFPPSGKAVSVVDIIHREFEDKKAMKLKSRSTQVRMVMESVVEKLLKRRYDSEQRLGVILWLKEGDLESATSLMHTAQMEKIRVHDDHIYRVAVHEDLTVSVVCFGCEILDPACEGVYPNVDALPDWVKDRLAVLMLMSPTPPTQDVENVGRRISDFVFWVYA